jgi:hypothetical protein
MKIVVVWPSIPLMRVKRRRCIVIKPSAYNLSLHHGAILIKEGKTRIYLLLLRI